MLFDAVVIDEGSQMPLAQALVAVRWLAPGGWLVVGGDHLQARSLRERYYDGPAH